MRETAGFVGGCRVSRGVVVDYKEFAGRPHFAGAPGWEAVADYALDWADRHTGATASSV